MWEVLPQKLVPPKNWLPPKIDLKEWLPPKKLLPQKIDQKKIGYPKKNVTPKKKIKKMASQKFWRTLLRGGLLLHFGKMAYFILYGFINAI